MATLRVAVQERVAAARHVLQPAAGHLGDLLEPGRQDEGLEPHAQGVGPAPGDQVGQAGDLLGPVAQIGQLHLGSGDVAGQHLEFGVAALRAGELGDRGLAAPGGRRAPRLECGDVGPRREAGELGIGQHLAQRGHPPVVLVEGAVQGGEAASVEQRRGRSEQIGEAGLRGPLRGGQP